MEKIGKYTISGEIGKGGMGIVYRGSVSPGQRLNVLGFRVAMDNR